MKPDTDQSLALVFLRGRYTRTAGNVLTAALETDPQTGHLHIDLPETAEDFFEIARAHLKTGRMILAALSFTSAARRSCLTLVRSLREQAPQGSGLVLLAGGPHPSALPEDCLDMGFDAVVHGEGEQAFPAFVKTLLQQGDWSQVPGLVWRDHTGKLTQNKRGPLIRLDDYPAIPHNRRILGSIEITRGCPHACAFCQVSHFHGGKPRHRSVENILEATELICERKGRHIRFVTPDAFSYGSIDGRAPAPGKVEQLLRTARKLAGNEAKLYLGSFPSEVRPEHVTKDLVGLVRQFADNDNLIIGAQSGSDRLLESCGRGHTVQDVRRAVRIVLENGLAANVDIIFGLPGETHADREATLDFMREMASLGARIHTHTFMPIPGTRWGNQPPGRIHNEVRAALKREFVPRGLAYGNWKEQEELARAIARLDT